MPVVSSLTHAASAASYSGAVQSPRPGASGAGSSLPGFGLGSNRPKPTVIRTAAMVHATLQSSKDDSVGSDSGAETEILSQVLPRRNVLVPRRPRPNLGTSGKAPVGQVPGGQIPGGQPPSHVITSSASVVAPLPVTAGKPIYVSTKVQTEPLDAVFSLLRSVPDFLELEKGNWVYSMSKVTNAINRALDLNLSVDDVQDGLRR